MLSLFTELTFVIVLAACLAIIARRLGQPTILGYLLAGLIVGYGGFFILEGNKEVYELFSDLGVMFLLFLVGLEINYESIRIVGRDAVLIGLGQIIFTFVFGFLVANAFGFSVVAAIYIAFALTISSTVIVVNILSEKRDLNTLYGKISIGILLIQDIVVILAIVLLGGGEERLLSTMVMGVLLTLGKSAILFIVAFFLSRKIIPRFFSRLARSPELVFLSGLAWLFAVASGTEALGFSKEIGGFIAGLTLANSYENFQVAYRLKSLRDFFMLVFFVTLGAGIVAFSDFTDIVAETIVFSLFVLLGGPLIVFMVMSFLGYPKRPSFLSGLAIAQVSEFSFILATLGFSLGHLDSRAVTLITSVGVITIVVSTYLMAHGNTLFRFFSPYLSFFERKKVKTDRARSRIYKRPIILIGFHRTGQSIAENLPKEFLFIVEYDPLMLSRLDAFGAPYFFGDMNDDEMLAHIDSGSARAVISTSPDVESNLVLLKDLIEFRKKTRAQFKIILRGRTDTDAIILYKHGADYVLLPHFSAGRYFAKIVAGDPYLQTIHSMKEEDIERLREITDDI